MLTSFTFLIFLLFRTQMSFTPTKIIYFSEISLLICGPIY